MSDGEITARVERALRSNRVTRRQDIDVEVEEGVVSLSGKAPSAAVRDAEAMARRVEGVKDVVNTIDIEETERPERPEQAERAEQPEPPELPEGIPMPPHPRGRPTPDAAAVQRLLREAHAAMKAGNAGEAMGKFGAVLGMDRDNQEAKQGMKDATILLGQNIRKMVPAFAFAALTVLAASRGHRPRLDAGGIRRPPGARRRRRRRLRHPAAPQRHPARAPGPRPHRLRGGVGAQGRRRPGRALRGGRLRPLQRRPARARARGHRAALYGTRRTAGPACLRLLDARPVGFIVGGFARAKGEPDIGKFTLTLVKGARGRWLIQSDMDNGNTRSR